MLPERDILKAQTRECLRLARAGGFSDCNIAQHLNTGAATVWRWRTGRNVPIASLYIRLEKWAREEGFWPV